ncbi:hypothetical protein N9R36_00990, partial [bacterium]|nr:hypothetical protein [bacterium]
VFVRSNSADSSLVRLLSPMNFFIGLLPFVKFWQKTVIILINVFTVVIAWEMRANTLNVLMPCVIAFVAYNKSTSLVFVIGKLRGSILASLIVMIVLGVTGVFNSYTYFLARFNTGNEILAELLADSRSGIYLDVFNALIRSDRVFFGLGIGAKVETHLSLISHSGYSQIYSAGRIAAEAGILNYLQWCGVLGALIVVVLYLKISFGLWTPKSGFARYLSLWIIFKLFMLFFEERIQFNLVTIFPWVVLSVATLYRSKKDLLDEELKQRVR